MAPTASTGGHVEFSLGLSYSRPPVFRSFGPVQSWLKGLFYKLGSAARAREVLLYVGDHSIVSAKPFTSMSS